MAGAKLDFNGGYIAIERCKNPENGKQYLRAVTYDSSRGLTRSGPVENEIVQQFALDVMKQAVYALGYTKDDIITLGLEKIIDDIRAEHAAAPRH